MNPDTIKKRLDELLAASLTSFVVCINESEELDEVMMKRVVRNGKIVKKVAVKRKGFKVINRGGKITFKRMTQQEKKSRRKGARKAWKVGKSARKVKSNRTLKRSKVRIKTLHGR